MPNSSLPRASYSWKVYPQKVTLYQVGDSVEGGSNNNFLDALDASYCTYAGGDASM